MRALLPTHGFEQEGTHREASLPTPPRGRRSILCLAVDPTLCPSISPPPAPLSLAGGARGRREDVGVISTRSALLVGYLLVLHLMVMWSFSPHPAPLCTTRELQLP